MAGGTTTIFHYDLRGHLIAETNQAGQILAEYIYIGDQLLSMIKPGGAVYYFHNDHLGTPQVLTNDSQGIVWKAVYTPFGEAVPSIETVDNPIRFPGQYYDPETGLHYNYFRYYNPQTGRYITPDPIGLEGGINLFVYVWNNPINQIDPSGLEAWIKCLRCGKKGPLSCRIIEDGVETGFIITNWGTNCPSETPGDPYGKYGPLPPIAYRVPNDYSQRFGRILPSPTNTGNPGEVRTPKGTLRKGIRYHAGSYSEGCPTLGSGSSGRRLEDVIEDIVNRHRGHGGTGMTIEEVDCCD